MTVITPTRSNGARSVPIEMTEVPPEATMPADVLSALAPDAGVNGQFLSDLLSGFLAHEQCGVHLYRTVAGATANPVLQGKYRQFLGQTEHHVEVLTQLITELGGDPLYVSPTARLVHGMNTYLLQSVVLAAGSADELPREMAMLEAVLLAETKDHADWAFLSALCDELPEGSSREAIRRAVEEVEPDEDEHVGWAKSTWNRMTQMQVSSSTMMKITDFAEKAFASVKNAVTGD
jgi:rubrerythrin